MTTAAVKGRIAAQRWAVGRSGDELYNKMDGPYPYVRGKSEEYNDWFGRTLKKIAGRRRSRYAAKQRARNPSLLTWALIGVGVWYLFFRNGGESAAALLEYVRTRYKSMTVDGKQIVNFAIEQTGDQVAIVGGPADGSSKLTIVSGPSLATAWANAKEMLGWVG